MTDRGVHKNGLDWTSETEAHRAFTILSRPPAADTGDLTQARAADTVRVLFGEGGPLTHDPLSAHPYPTDPGSTATGRDRVEHVMLAGDWHGNTRWARDQVTLAAAAGVRVLVQLGDFGLWPGARGRTFLDELNGYARKVGVTIVWLDGNHEDFDQLARYPQLTDGPAAGLRPIRSRIWHLPRGTRWTWHGLTWCAIGGATSVDRAHRVQGTSWWPQESLSYDEVDQILSHVDKHGRVDVLLTHDAPEPRLIPGLGPFTWGHSELRRAQAHHQVIATLVDRLDPTHLWHGHFHLAYQRIAPLRAHKQPVQITGLAHDQREQLDGLQIRASQIIDLADLATQSAALR